MFTLCVSTRVKYGMPEVGHCTQLWIFGRWESHHTDQWVPHRLSQDHTQGCVSENLRRHVWFVCGMASLLSGKRALV